MNNLDKNTVDQGIGQGAVTLKKYLNLFFRPVLYFSIAKVVQETELSKSI
jgi:hypothetical protein